MKGKSHQKKILEVLYHAGYHFTVTENCITVVDTDEKDSHTLSFTFSSESEDLISIDIKDLDD